MTKDIGITSPLEKMQVESGLSQKTFSEVLGIGKTTYERWKNTGVDPRMSSEQKFVLSGLTGYSIEKLSRLLCPDFEKAFSRGYKARRVEASEQKKLCPRNLENLWMNYFRTSLTNP